MFMAAPEPNPQVRALYEHCARRPRAVRSRRWGETVFKVDHRAFAFLGRLEEPSVTVKLPRRERRPLLRRGEVVRDRFVGFLGWVTVHVVDQRTMDLACELVDRSYERAARPG